MSFSKLFYTYLHQPVPQDSLKVERLNCPLCDKENHFYANCENGLWDCKSCGESGNARGLITQIHETFWNYTTAEHYKQLSEERHILPVYFEKAQWVYDQWHDRWYVPFPNGTDFLANLGYFSPSHEDEKLRYRIMKAPGMEQYLYRPFVDITPHTYICEGEWDALALQQILKTKDAIVAAPGANIFKKEFLQSLKPAKEITLLYDNDNSGLKGMYRAAELLTSAGKTVRILDWSAVPDAPKHIRDLLSHKYPKPATAIKSAIVDLDISTISQSTIPKYTTSIDDIDEIYSFQDYMKEIRRHLYISRETERAFIAVLAVAATINVDGEMLWVFLVGPPSCGKTTLIESFGGTNESFEYVSKLTSEALISGSRTEDGSDASNLPSFNNKGVFIKDFTVCLSMPRDVQHKLYGLMRDIYDGTVKIMFGNGLVKEYHGINFNLVAGVTDAIHSHNDAELGERFLRIDYLGHNYKEDAILDKALDNVGKRKDNKGKLTNATLGFMKHIFKKYADAPPPVLTPKTKYLIKSYAKLVARVRTKPKSDRNEGLIYKPRPEIATRLALQLTKELIGITRILGQDEVTTEALSILKKVTLDSCYGFVFDVLNHIYKNPKIRKQDLAIDLNLPPSRINRIITDLKSVKLIRQDTLTNRSGQRGRNDHIFTLQPSIQELFDALNQID